AGPRQWEWVAGQTPESLVLLVTDHGAVALPAVNRHLGEGFDPQSRLYQRRDDTGDRPWPAVLLVCIDLSRVLVLVPVGDGDLALVRTADEQLRAKPQLTVDLLERAEDRVDLHDVEDTPGL